jgi:c-di-GMP-related signal transduction protein
VNFPREVLFHKVVEHLSAQFVIELREGVIATCGNLRHRGYRVALDDYCFEHERDALLEVAAW